MTIEDLCNRAISLINNCKDCSDDEKKEIIKNCEGDKTLLNLVYLYYFPRNLLDRELPSRVKKESHINHVVHLVEACKTPQYKRFMMHLFHSFLDPSKVHPVTLNEPVETPLFGDVVYGRKGEFNNMDQWDAWKSDDSEIILSLQEYLALLITATIIRAVEPNFLHNWPTDSKNFFDC